LVARSALRDARASPASALKSKKKRDAEFAVNRTVLSVPNMPEEMT
jgi:hypothetical protein